MHVEIRFEEKRLCGYRKPSKDGVGIYLRGDGILRPCERLPFVLDFCPCCGAGITPSRGFTWIDPIKLFDPELYPGCTHHVQPVHGQHEYLTDDCATCVMCNPWLAGHQAGLIWIGEQHYKTPHDFVREARTMGISRKIAAIPTGFEVGKHWIYLAHRKALQSLRDDGKIVWQGGVFMTFQPSVVELVIDNPDNVPDKAIEIVKRLGEDKAKIVKVIHDTEEEMLLDE